MAIDRVDLVALIEGQLEQAHGYGSGELQQVRTKALDRYYGRPRGDEKPGRSAAQSSDVADMVEALTAQLVPSFAGDSVVTFEPLSEDDTDQAWLETGVVNRVILEENRGYLMLQESLRDALLLRNGWLKAWREETRRTDYEQFDGIPLDAVPQLLQGEAQPASGARIERDLVGVTDNEDGTINARIKVQTTRERMRVAAVDPVCMRWSKGYDSLNLQEIPFLAEQFFPTRSWLVERGYRKADVYDLVAVTDPSAPDWRGRARSDSADFAETTDRAMQRVECYWVHMRCDADGDGVAEIHRILYCAGAREGGARILSDEVVSFIPYATGTPWVQPHRLDGLGVWDKLNQVEAVKTTALRQWLDNLGHCNSSRLAVNVRSVQLQDVLDNRPGGVVRVNGEPGGQLLPITAPDIGASIMGLMQYQDTVRSERGGASLDLQTSSAQIAGETAHGVERQYTAREQQAAMICRSLAETLVRELYLIVHRGMREWLQQPVKANYRGKFTMTEPSKWPERDHVNVQTGLSVSERNRKRMALEIIIQQQEKLVAGGFGGILVTPDGYHAAIMDWSRAAEVDNAERYFADPQSEGSQRAAQQKQAEQQQLQAMQVQIAQTAAAAAQQQQLIDNQIRKYEADQKTALDYFREVMKAELELLKAGQEQAVRELQLVGMTRSNEENAEADKREGAERAA